METEGISAKSPPRLPQVDCLRIAPWKDLRRDRPSEEFSKFLVQEAGTWWDLTRGEDMTYGARSRGGVNQGRAGAILEYQDG